MKIKESESGAGRFIVFMLWSLLAVMVVLHFANNRAAIPASEATTIVNQWAADSTWNKGWNFNN